MTCGAALNIEGQHYGCNNPVPHPQEGEHSSSIVRMRWRGDRLAHELNTPRVRCDLTEPHPGLGHSNRELQALWTNGQEHTMTEPATVEGKRAQRALSDNVNVTVNRGGPQYTVPTTVEGARVNAPNIQTWGAGGIYAEGANTSAMADTPQDLMDRARTMRDTYRSAGWAFTITDQEDQSGRRVVIDAFLPDRGEHR